MARVKINLDGTKRYVDDYNQLHREDGPAIIYKSGEFHNYVHGSNNLPDRPAGFFRSGYYIWRKNGFLNRSDGPAMDYPNGLKVWYVFVGEGLTTWPQLK